METTDSQTTGLERTSLLKFPHLPFPVPGVCTYSPDNCSTWYNTVPTEVDFLLPLWAQVRSPKDHPSWQQQRVALLNERYSLHANVQMFLEIKYRKMHIAAPSPHRESWTSVIWSRKTQVISLIPHFNTSLENPRAGIFSTYVPGLWGSADADHRLFRLFCVLHSTIKITLKSKSRNLK